MTWTRSTYSLLDWLGDLGGLFEALSYICAVFIQPLTVFTLKTTLLTSLFRFQEQKAPIDDASDSKNMQDEIGASERISSMNYFHVRCLPCWQRPSAQNYLKILRKS